MKYFSMFTGVGGFELGIERATKGKWTCVGFSEIDKYASELLKQKFPTIKNYGDATKINTKELQDFDILLGGFPCQTFSIAGKRKGFSETRGTLFFDICRIVKHKKPQYIFLENVKGLLSHDRGRTFAVILSSMDELGYDVEWQVCNSKFFGVPQNRERVFIIGHLRGKSRCKIFPFKQSNSNINEPEGKIIMDVKSSRQIKRIYNPMGISPALHLNTGGWQEPKIAIKAKFQKTVYDDKGIAPTLMEGHGDVIRIVASRGRNPNNPSDRTVGSPTEQRLEPNSEGISNTITSVQKDNLVMMENANAVTPDAYLARGERKRVDGKAVLTSMNERRIRKLTPLECERLQGFPDGWTSGFSNTQREKMMGNAVTVNVVEAIVRRFKG